MKFILHLSSFIILLALCSGCASSGGNNSTGERTLKFKVPPVQYETFEPVFPTP